MRDRIRAKGVEPDKVTPSPTPPLCRFSSPSLLCLLTLLFLPTSLRRGLLALVCPTSALTIVEKAARLLVAATRQQEAKLPLHRAYITAWQLTVWREPIFGAPLDRIRSVHTNPGWVVLASCLIPSSSQYSQVPHALRLRNARVHEISGMSHLNQYRTDRGWGRPVHVLRSSPGSDIGLPQQHAYISFVHTEFSKSACQSIARRPHYDVRSRGSTTSRKNL